MIEEKKDFFDRIMSWPVLVRFEPWYKKNKEVLLYLFFGGLTFFVSLGSFVLFDRAVGFNELVANVISWVLAVVFAFFTNRIWVFEGYTENRKEFVQQMSGFFLGRVVTLLIEEIILAVFISWLGMNSILVKTGAQIVVIVANYVISKWFVFGKKNEDKQ